MALLEDDTALTGGDGVYQGVLSEDWRIWSPNDGYLMAMILRAAGKASDWPKPLSMMCQFLAVGKFAPVELHVISLRQTRSAEAMRISMIQEGRILVEALVWTGETVPGYEHDFADAPEVADPAKLNHLHELVPELESPYPFFDNYHYKPIDFTPWEDASNEPPYQKGWYQFTPTGDYGDPFVDAGRYVILLDTFGWTAASQAHRDDPSFMAPTLSLSVDFHRFDSCDWLLSDSSGDIAEEGLIGVRNRIWSEDRKLLASASGTLLCRKRPGMG